MQLMTVGPGKLDRSRKLNQNICGSDEKIIVFIYNMNMILNEFVLTQSSLNCPYKCILYI